MKLALLRVYSFFLRRLRPNSGLTKLSFNRPVNFLFAGQTAPLATVTSEGYPIEIDPHDHDGRVLWLFGTNDWKVSRTVCALLEDGDVLLDIGANHGSIGFAAAGRVGRTGRVHLFEPQPVLVEKLRRTVTSAGLGNVEVHEAALYDRDGEMDLWIPAHHSGKATLETSRARNARWAKRSVPVREAGAYLSELLEGRPAGVKIDVEGAEEVILRRLFDCTDVRFVLFEGANRTEALRSLFQDAGFFVYGLRRNVFSVRLDAVKGARDWGRYHDFLALPLRVDLPDAAIPLGAIAESLSRTGRPRAGTGASGRPVPAGPVPGRPAASPEG